MENKMYTISTVAGYDGGVESSSTSLEGSENKATKAFEKAVKKGLKEYSYLPDDEKFTLNGWEQVGASMIKRLDANQLKEGELAKAVIVPACNVAYEEDGDKYLSELFEAYEDGYLSDYDVVIITLCEGVVDYDEDDDEDDYEEE